MRIDRCTCHDMTFKELKEIASNNDIRDLKSLMEYIQFGDNCTLCRPYVREMLASGEVVYHQIITDQE